MTYFILLATLGVANYGTKEISAHRKDIRKNFWGIYTLQLIATILSLALYTLIVFVLSWHAKYGGLYLRIKLDIERNGYFLVIPRFGGFSSYYRKEYNGKGFRSYFYLPICENTW